LGSTSVDNGDEKKKKRTQLILLLATNLVSLAFLYWALRDSNLSQTGAELKRMGWWWVGLAVVTDILVYFWHGWRWSLLLSPLECVPFWTCVRAIYVGLFANEVLPFRTGELIRCFLLARWTTLPLSVTLSSALIERIFDGLWLIVCLIITIQFVHLPKYLVDGAWVLATVVGLCGVLLAIALFYKQQTKEVFANTKNPILKTLNILIEDLHIIGHSRFLYFAAFASIPYLLMQAVPIWALAKGYPGFDLTIAQSFALMVILRLGSVVPQAPGNLGLFQSLTRVGLVLFGVPHGIASRFSLVVWGVITLPLLIVGFIALAVTGLKMGDLHREAHGCIQNNESIVRSRKLE
jgi:glycosyltransferase 2 family protein